MANPRKYRRPRKAARRPVRKAVRRTRKSSTVSLIKRTIGRMAEKKQMRYYGTGSTSNYVESNWLSNGILPLTPNNAYMSITQGDGKSQRCGNSVVVKNYTLSGVVVPLGYNGTTNLTPQPLDVLMVIFKRRDGGSTLDPYMYNFYNSPNSSVSPGGSGAPDLLLPINKDRYQILYRRVFKIGFATNAGTGSQAQQQSHTSNDYKYSQRFRINATKMIPKVLRYQDSTNTPNCNITYIAFFAYDANGNTAAATDITFKWDLCQTLDYTDI